MPKWRGGTASGQVVLGRLAEPATPTQPSPFDVFEEGVARFDVDARIVYVNPALASRFQRPVEQVLGRSLWDIYPEALEDQLSGALRRVLGTSGLGGSGNAASPSRAAG